jgi:hypothetical protein
MRADSSLEGEVILNSSSSSSHFGFSIQVLTVLRQPRPPVAKIAARPHMLALEPLRRSENSACSCLGDLVLMYCASFAGPRGVRPAVNGCGLAIQVPARLPRLALHT